MTDAASLENVCLSGGAEGADALWGSCAGALGHAVIHWSFEGHRTQVPASEVLRLTREQLEQADPMLHRANLTLRRRFPPTSPFSANLLRRNWYQVETASGLYAVSSLKDGKVEGGTAWAIQMFLDRHPTNEPLSAYLYCQKVQEWLHWDGKGWETIGVPPPPSGLYAAIGTRDLTPDGKRAIRTLMRWDETQSGRMRA